jgi:hypothetical protein
VLGIVALVLLRLQLLRERKDCTALTKWLAQSWGVGEEFGDGVVCWRRRVFDFVKILHSALIPVAS